MSLAPCPECEQPVSTRAIACPRCGLPFRDPPTLVVPDELKIVDARIPYGSMIELVFRWAIASIVVGVLLGIILGVIYLLLTAASS